MNQMDSRCQAVDDLYYLERACEVVVKAKSMGEELNVIGDKAAQAFMDDFQECGMVRPPRERESRSLQSTHISVCEHSSQDRLIGRGIPGVSFGSR